MSKKAGAAPAAAAAAAAGKQKSKPAAGAKPSGPYAISFADTLEAEKRTRAYIHTTPMMTCSTFDRMVNEKRPAGDQNVRLYFKCENFQKVGAFKFRGACNAVFALSKEDAKKGVCTHSSGNFAQALALAARMRGAPAHIVMPSNAPAVKKNAVRGYGATVIECEPTLAARELSASAVCKETGATFIHPYDDAMVMAGHGTMLAELFQQIQAHVLSELRSKDIGAGSGPLLMDALIVPVGGGGLLSGLVIAARHFNPKIRIFGAEPIGADDAKRSFDAKELIPQTGPNTIADGLLTSVGVRPWPIIRDLVEDIITVSEPEIVTAMQLVWERMKIVIEASSAVAFAAALSPKFKDKTKIKRVGVIFTGGNLSFDKVPFLSAKPVYPASAAPVSTNPTGAAASIELIPSKL